MKRILAMLLALVMVFALVACSGGNNSGGNNSGGSGGGSTTKGEEGSIPGVQKTLTIGIASDINELDPQQQNDQINNHCIALTHQPLVFLTNDTNEQVACLAESWEWTDDTHLIFHLVQNATFNDGSPFTADDVVFTLEKAMDPAQSAVAATLQRVESVHNTHGYS